MLKTRSVVVLTVTILGLAGLAQARQNILKNGSHEAGPGPNGPDPRQAASWTYFGGRSVERTNEAQYPFGLGPGHALKMFGTSTTVGAYQDVPAAPGQQVAVSVRGLTWGYDAIDGDAAARLKVEFRQANDDLISELEIVVLDFNSPVDTWIPASVGPLAAPAGTAKARIVLSFTYTENGIGSAFFDDAALTINGGLNELDNGDFEQLGTLADNARGIDDFIGFNYQEKSIGVIAARDGQAVVKVDVDASQPYSGIYQDTIDLQTGDRIWAQTWVWNPSVGGLSGGAGGSKAALKLEFYAAGGGSTPPPTEALEFDGTDPVNTWVQVSTSAVVPEGITGARVVILRYISDPNLPATGPVYADSAVARRNGGANVLLNPSFEDGVGNAITNWNFFFTPLVSAVAGNGVDVPAQAGFRVAKMQGTGTAGLFQAIQVAPGETLDVSAFFRHRSTGTPPAGGPFNTTNCPSCAAGVKIEWIVGGVPGQIDIGGAPNNTLFATGAQDQWVPLWIDYTMPPGSHASVRWTDIVAKDGGTTATVYFDAGEAVVINFFDGGDVDGDNDQDLRDFAHMQRVFSGSGVTPMLWNTFTFDTDFDKDVDVTDWLTLSTKFTAPN